MKKCCLNCAFCIRRKDKKVYTETNSSLSILTDIERRDAFKDNFDFIGKEIREQKDWEDLYSQILDNLKKGVYNKQLGNAVVLDLLDETPFQEPFSLARTFNMPPRPDAPDADYLICWHNLWNFKNKESELVTLKNRNKCLFFYPYNRKENKSFEGCEKERIALQNQYQFRTTNLLVILGIIVSFLIYALQKYDTRKTTSLSEKASLVNITTPETIKKERAEK